MNFSEMSLSKRLFKNTTDENQGIQRPSLHNKPMAVIISETHGHGAVPLARTENAHAADYFGVAQLS